MSNKLRKIKRNNLKTHFGNNKINDFWHQENDPLWKRLKRGMENVNKQDKK